MCIRDRLWSVAVPVEVAVKTDPRRSKCVASITAIVKVPVSAPVAIWTVSPWPKRCGADVVARAAPAPLSASAVIVAVKGVVTLLGSPWSTVGMGTVYRRGAR